MFRHQNEEQIRDIKIFDESIWNCVRVQVFQNDSTKSELHSWRDYKQINNCQPEIQLQKV